MSVSHRLGVIRRETNGRYYGSCICGFEILSPDPAGEPDVEARKDFVYGQLSTHFLAQPEIRAAIGLA